MYKRHLEDGESLERQVRDVVDDFGKVIKDLDTQLQRLGKDVCTKTLSKLKESNAKLQEVTGKLLKKNTELQQTIKAQAAKIQHLESTVSQLRTDMRTMKEEQDKKDKHLQDQIDDIKRNMADNSTRIESQMSNIHTIVMGADRFKQSLGKNPPPSKMSASVDF